MRLLSVLITFLAFSVSLFAQNDRKAEKVLKDVSKRYEKAKGIKAAFTIVTYSGVDKSKSTEKGTIYIRGNNFRLEIAGQEIFCDGKTIWTYQKVVNEVQINNYESSENELNPANLFTMYSKGYFYKLDGEVKEGAKTYTVVELAPKDKNKQFHKVKILVDKANNAIYSSEIRYKNGNIVTYTINSQDLNQKFDKNFFTFNSGSHKGLIVTDLR